ncbi:LON peptidase substrate-binding domain-containing protein [Mycolicibacter sp. MYC123]|uniref:LON peptidase substrate-binding domain-containing protein n=1 Tax=[Mycobacterium] zoologicum TaxID=2872311 RepID=A0ABU5YIV8_9MYCO|nr:MULTISPECIES: LON peptidase substrate-binding domain-containing protein [unclassified Mycolicibacter]MEB3049983.1 LON peptidase substrate-binding domain-containing protein [Mycolicibacter sp. MYC123]MEB3062347.1 LON peptidase substrate-binding domain-containing protein [Mycolicibacter sp. MYC101]
MELPMFPLEWVLLPGEELSLRIFEMRYTVLVGDLMRSGDPRFGVVLIARGREVGGGEQRNDVGTMTSITNCAELGAGRYALRCLTGERIRVGGWLVDDPYPRADVELWPDEPGEPVSDSRFRELEDRIVALHKQMAVAQRRWLAPGRNAMLGGRRMRSLEPTQRLYSLACRVPMGEADRYAVLAAPSLNERLTALHEAIETVSARVEFESPR